MDGEDLVRLGAIIDEAHRLADRVRDGTKAIDSINNLGVTVVGTVVGVGLGTGKQLVILIGPVAGLLLLIHAVQTFTELLMMAGHRRFLETYLGDQFGAPVLCHETTIGQARSSARDLLFKQILYAAVVMTVTVVAGFVVRHQAHQWLFIAYIGFSVAGYVTLGYSVWVMRGAEQLGFGMVKKYFEGFHSAASPQIP